MYSFIFSLLFAALSALAAYINLLSMPWVITAGVVGFFVALILMGRFVVKRSAPVQEELKRVMEVGQNRIQRDIQHFQSKPGAGPKAVQMQIERKKKAMLQEVLPVVDKLKPFKKYSALMGRQISTMKMQFHYQLNEFDKVDEILAQRNFFSKPILNQPMLVGMKMARLYKKKDFDGVEKTFKRHLIWFRGEQASLLYGVLSWVYVKQGKMDEAQAILAKGKEKTGHETLERNWEAIANGNPKKFNNRGLGDEWYALGLENPPQPKAQRMRGKAAHRF